MIEIEGEPWFVAVDTLKVLTIGNTTKATQPLDEDEKRRVKRTTFNLGKGAPMICVSESGLYKIIMRSDKPEAKAFQDWVTREVLPSILVSQLFKLTS